MDGEITWDYTGFVPAEDNALLTNADRIRDMTDEELADWLCQIMDSCLNFGSKGECPESCPMYKCCNDQHTDNIEDWLRSPVEVEE